MTTLAGGMRMVAPAVEGIDLFKIAGRSISGWIPSLKTGSASHVRQPFCSQLEERLLLWLEYHPQVISYERSLHAIWVCQFWDRPLMPPRSTRNNGNTFTGTCGLWSRCEPSHLKPE
jgi:hypothetical protein